jgi:HEPN domain-containing protein
MLAGDRRGALDAARRARRLVAQALRAIGGDAALEALIERIEALALTAEDDVFNDAAALRAELEVIAAQARVLLAEGDTLAAAARALLGEQRARHRRGRRDHPDIDVDRARLAVSLAGTAVSLAERLIADQTVPVISDAHPDDSDRQNRWLGHAQKLLEKAEEALANGDLRRAVHFAHHAQWSALKAVILPGGITEEEVWAMVELAQSLHEQAEDAFGDDPSELKLRLFRRAGELIEIGIAKLEEGNKRGVAALWRAAVISSWLIA